VRAWFYTHKTLLKWLSSLDLVTPLTLLIASSRSLEPTSKVLHSLVPTVGFRSAKTNPLLYHGALSKHRTFDKNLQQGSLSGPTCPHSVARSRDFERNFNFTFIFLKLTSELEITWFVLARLSLFSSTAQRAEKRVMFGLSSNRKSNVIRSGNTADKPT